jgi:hypothetical protein
MQEFPDLVQGVVALADEAGLAGVAGSLRAMPIPAPNASWQDWQQYANALFAILRDERDLWREWEFSQKEIDTLNDYFYAQELLMQCLKVAVVSDRQAILQGLLSPPQG